MKCSLGISNFLEEISSLSILLFSSISCIDHQGRLSYLSLLFFETLNSDGYLFPFLPDPSSFKKIYLSLYRFLRNSVLPHIPLTFY